jgi:predicted HTH transcriptional regulator
MLMRYMENMDYTERLGMGVPMIIREVKKLSGKEPLLEERDGGFCHTLFPKRGQLD